MLCRDGVCITMLHISRDSMQPADDKVQTFDRGRVAVPCACSCVCGQKYMRGTQMESISGQSSPGNNPRVARCTRQIAVGLVLLPGPIRMTIRTPGGGKARSITAVVGMLRASGTPQDELLRPTHQRPSPRVPTRQGMSSRHVYPRLPGKHHVAVFVGQREQGGRACDATMPVATCNTVRRNTQGGSAEGQHCVVARGREEWVAARCWRW